MLGICKAREPFEMRNGILEHLLSKHDAVLFVPPGSIMTVVSSRRAYTIPVPRCYHRFGLARLPAVVLCAPSIVFAQPDASHTPAPMAADDRSSPSSLA